MEFTSSMDTDLESRLLVNNFQLWLDLQELHFITKLSL